MNVDIKPWSTWVHLVFFVLINLWFYVMFCSSLFVLLAIVLSVHLWFAASGCSFGVFKLVFNESNSVYKFSDTSSICIKEIKPNLFVPTPEWCPFCLCFYELTFGFWKCSSSVVFIVFAVLALYIMITRVKRRNFDTYLWNRPYNVKPRWTKNNLLTWKKNTATVNWLSSKLKRTVRLTHFTHALWYICVSLCWTNK